VWLTPQQLEHLAHLREGLEAGGQKKQHERRTVPAAVKCRSATIWQVGGGNEAAAAVHWTSDGDAAAGFTALSISAEQSLRNL